MKHNSLALSIVLALTAQTAMANPQGAQVVKGTASFSSPSANVLNVTNSRNAIINWQQFNIDRGQTTNFIQPSASSSVLNRVIGNDPSQLLGNLNSNGRVFVINQNGILVGEGANINTTGFFASTLNMTDQDFLNGKLHFNGGGQGDVSNQGYIHAGADGNIVLIAPNVENGGVIEVENGNIILAAGESITITSLQNSALQFEVQSPANTVTNLGQVIARNGAAGLFAGTLKHSGSIRASGLVRDADGTIRLVASDTTQVSGAVQAAGGKIEILADTIEIQQGANIDASSESGGGEILIGGDRQGLNPDVKNATSTTIASGAQVHADGVGNADGGKVIVFAQNDVHVQGEITARGGAQGGDGGFIETSGLKQLDITAVPDASAANGEGGEWLIDPNNITLISGTGANITGNPDFTSTDDNALLDVGLVETALNGGNNVTITTGTGGTNNQLGDISIQASIVKSAPNAASLTLNAHNSIKIGDGVGATIDIQSTAGAMDVSFNADSDADGNGAIIFNTGFGNSAPITIDTNGGVFSTNQDVFIDGDVSNTFSRVNINNSQWEIKRGTVLEISEDLTLAGSTLINNGRIGINNFSANLDLGGTTLDIPLGASLVGEGTLIGDVTVNGGSIAGGTGYQSFGVLNINGALTIDSGVLYSVIGGLSTNWESSSISANSIVLNGGDLMVVWSEALAVQQASNDSLFSQLPLGLANCGGTGCITGAGLNNVINPLLVTNSTVAIGGNGDVLQYGITYASDIVQNATIKTWNGPSVGLWTTPANWSGGTLPTASDYVFLENPDGLYQVDVSGTQAVAGLQSFANLRVQGSLTLGGNSYFTSDGNPGSGGLWLSSSTSLIDGAATIYAGPGSSVLLGQGVLAKNLTSWGISRFLDAASSFQLDSVFTNNGIFIVDDTSGVNTLAGTGSIINNRLTQVSANFSSSVQFTNSSGAELLLDTAGFNTLFEGNTVLDGTLSALTGSSIVLAGGTHVFSASLLQDGVINFSGGTYQGTFNQAASSTLNINASDSNVIFDAFVFNSLGTVNVGNSINSFGLTNTSLWSNGGALNMAAGSKVDVLLAGSQLTLGSGTDLSGSAAGTISVSGGGFAVNPALDFATPGITLDLVGGATATFNANVIAGNVVLDGTLNNGGSLDITNFNWQAGTLTSTLNATGSTQVSNQMNLTGLAAMSLNQALTLNAGAQANWSSSIGDLTLQSTAANITNDGSWNDSSTRSITGSTGSFFNNGSYIANTTGVSTLAVPFNNAPTASVNVQAGTLALLGGGTSGGSFTVSDRLQMGGSHTLTDATFSGSGVFEQLAGSSVLFTTGSASFALDTIIGNSGQLFLSQDTTISNLQLTTAGVLISNGNLNVSNFQWIDGTLRGSGVTTVATLANLSGSGTLLLDAQTLNLQNTTNWTGAGGSLALSNGAVINNAGTFNDTSSAQITGAGSSFNNTGDYVLNSTGTSTLAVPLTNSGNIQLIAGTLDLAGNALLLGAGRLSGTGSVIANVFPNVGGVIAPGAAGGLGTLNINGNLTFAAGSIYELNLDTGAADQILVSGAVNIDSTAQLNITPINGYIGVVGDGGSVLNSTTGITGSFAPITQNADFTLATQYVTGPPDGLDISVVGVNNRWIATGDGAWETAANWSRNEVPVGGHDVFIDTGLAVTVNSQNTAGNAIRSLTAVPTSTFNLASSSALFSQGDVAVGSLNLDTANFTVNGNLSAGDISVINVASVLNGSGNLSVGSVLSMNNGTVSGWSSINAAQLTVQGNSQLLNTNYIHQGIMTLTATSDVLALNNTQMLSDAATGAGFSGSGRLDLNTGSGWTVNAISPQGMLMPVGMTLNLNGGQLINIENVGFPGTVNVNQPNFVENASLVIPATTTFNYLGNTDLTPSFDVINNGQFVIQSSAPTLNLSGANFINNSGATLSIATPTNLAVQSGASVINSGAITGSGALSANGGTLDFAVPTTLPSSLTLNLASGGIINNAQNLTVAGTFNWLDGTINGTGTNPVFTTQGQVNLDTGTLNTDWLIDSASTVSWGGGNAGDLVINNATITNAGVFHMAGQGDVVQALRSSAAKNFSASTNAGFINKGILLIDAGGDTIVFDLNFDNVGGQIGILSGTFQIGQNKDDLILDQADEGLFGLGIFDGNVINQFGVVAPGRFITETSGVTGVLTINGDYTQGPEASLIIKLDSTLDGLQNDVLNVTGQLNADGAIDFKLVNGSDIKQTALLIDQSFQPLKFNRFAGKFASTTIPDGLNFTLGEGGIITISANNNLLDEVNNQLEVLFSKDDLDYSKVVRAMKFVDQKVALLKRDSEEDDDEKKRAPRLVCK